MKEKILVIVGPTAVGKTALSLEIAKKCKGEIINADSSQFYKGMDIGTAKISTAEMEGIPHHLIDIRLPNEPMNVYEFKQAASQLINEITTRGHIPIMVGGTGLYVQSVLYDYSFPKVTSDATLREKLMQQSPEKSYQQLLQVDPAAAEKIHPNNHKRVIRALEVYLATGKTFSEQINSSSISAKYQAIVIGLTLERHLLYQRINQRVLQMIEQGLEKEVEALVNQGYENELSMQAIGYK